MELVRQRRRKGRSRTVIRGLWHTDRGAGYVLRRPRPLEIFKIRNDGGFRRQGYSGQAGFGVSRRVLYFVGRKEKASGLPRLFGHVVPHRASGRRGFHRQRRPRHSRTQRRFADGLCQPADFEQSDGGRPVFLCERASRARQSPVERHQGRVPRFAAVRPFPRFGAVRHFAARRRRYERPPDQSRSAFPQRAGCPRDYRFRRAPIADLDRLSDIKHFGKRSAVRRRNGSRLCARPRRAVKGELRFLSENVFFRPETAKLFPTAKSVSRERNLFRADAAHY